METNGERIEARMGTKSIGLSTRDLLPILTLILAGVGGYAIWVQASQGLTALYRQHERLEVLVEAQHANRAEYMREMVRLLSVAEYNRDKPPEERLPLALDPAMLASPRP